MKYPKMIRIKQNFKTNPIKDIPAAVRSELDKLQPQKIIDRGQTVAITAGSRGINNLAVILSEIVRELKKIGAKPFIIPAMGSHGGATPEGQKKILAHYGVTKENMGVPIKSSMQVIQIGTTPDGIPVYLDRYASQADHIVVFNRVKPHTDFKGKIESGLMKIMAIGLGKQKGADLYHNAIVRLGHYPVLTSVARVILDKCPIAFGVAVVENQRDETEIIRAIPAGEIEQTEPQLLRKAKRLLPQIPLNPIDLLIVDWMGKEISGTGMDQNVIGRTVISYHRPDIKIDILRIFVRDMTAESEGNATAIGNADFTTQRLVDKIDPRATYMNAVTSSCPEAVRIPPYFKTDREVIDTALNTIGLVEPQDARIVHIRDTLHLEEIYISQTMLAEAQKSKDISVIGSARPLKFGKDGNLVSDL
ncbi:MAG: DUF2088 domain-containing protein [Desulfobacterales bacterium]|nr:MAG: DUF2088 domain-containing protein [Desulfobacterales bacterium]